MKYCRNCNVLLSTEDDTCLLCYKKITTHNDDYNSQEYPKYFELSKENKKLQTMFFISGVLFGLVAIGLNLWFYKSFSFNWSLLVCFCSFLLWVAMRLVIFSQKNLSLKLMGTHLTLFWLLLIIDYFFASEGFEYWSLTYASPFLSVVFLTITLIIVISKIEAYPDYFGNIILHILFLFTPMILYFSTNVITTIIPAVIAMVIGLITLAGVFILPSSKTQEEIKKRLHI